MLGFRVEHTLLIELLVHIFSQAYLRRLYKNSCHFSKKIKK